MLGALPDFIILGTQKGGTTSLYHWLGQHPQIRRVRGSKEVHYFDDQYDRSLLWYRRQFPGRWRLELERARSGKALITGEASPYYLPHPHVPKRISSDVPHAKLIVLLRDPATRAWSHYRHNFRMGWETLSFEDALAQETARISEDRARLLQDESHRAHAFRRYSYRARGHYLEQLRRFELQAPGNPRLILRSEDLFSDPHGQFAKVLEYLGLEPFTPPDMKPLNQDEPGQAITDLAELRRYFSPLNAALEAHLDRSFAWS